MPVLVSLEPEENICELMLSTLYSTRHAALDPWPEVTSEVGNSINPACFFWAPFLGRENCVSAKNSRETSRDTSWCGSYNLKNTRTLENVLVLAPSVIHKIINTDILERVFSMHWCSLHLHLTN